MKEKLRHYLRKKKAESGLSNGKIAWALYASKEDVKKWFSDDSEKFEIPYSHTWSMLKSMLGIETDKFDEVVYEYHRNSR